MFFESGSTLTYVSTRLKRDEILHRGGDPRKVIEDEMRDSLVASTNGILTYLDNLFFPREYGFGISLWPAGPPEGTYGATFGDERIVENEPLNGNDWAYINDKSEILCGMDLLLVTSSGLNLTNGNFPLGLHVGSFKNKVFKIAILKARAPKIYFMDESKIDCEIREDHCRFVAEYVDPETGREATWRDLGSEQPIAFCVGTLDAGAVGWLESSFSEHLGLDRSLLISPEQEGAATVLFVYNESFEVSANEKGWSLG